MTGQGLQRDLRLAFGRKIQELDDGPFFEPFFTTKEKGKGTGLGLSTVYGIIQQSGGSISVDSTPGKGTAFRIYFPKVDDPAQDGSAAGVFSRVIDGSETILLLEDEPDLRGLMRLSLENSGYRILEAHDPREAIEVAAGFKDPIDLLLTDVIMPGMSGPQVAASISQLRAETKVLYVTGYTDDMIGDRRVLEPSVILLQKPFTRVELVKKVQEALLWPTMAPLLHKDIV